MMPVAGNGHEKPGIRAEGPALHPAKGEALEHAMHHTRFFGPTGQLFCGEKNSVRYGVPRGNRGSLPWNGSVDARTFSSSSRVP